MLDLSVIIVNWNTRALLVECLTSLYATLKDVAFDVWVVDNASTDGSVQAVRSLFPQVQLVCNSENAGFAYANNQALALSTGRYRLLFNSDAVATPGSVQALLEVAEAHPKAAVVGARLLNSDGSFQASYTPFPTLWQEFLILSGLGRRLHGAWYPSRSPEIAAGSKAVDYVEGACLLVRGAAYESVGGLDESYFMYSEEVDWCFRFKEAGWLVWYQPQAGIIHHGSASSQHRRTQREADLYQSRVRFFHDHYGNGQAAILKGLIIGLTGLKLIWHRLLRWISRGHKGRAVVAMQDLWTALSKV